MSASQPTAQTILAIDTATGPCSVAVWKDGRIAAYREDMRTVTQSVSLMPMVEAALKKSRTAYQDLSLVACTIGPGSFTGIRVGLAAARGICFSAGIPGVGATTLEVLAFAARGQDKGEALTILNAGKGEWYHRRYRLPELTPLSDIALGTQEQATTGLPDGSLIIGNAPICNSDVSFPRADLLAALAAQRGHGAKEEMHPFYLRAPDAKLPTKNIV